MSHFIDLLVWWFGEIDKSNGFLARQNHDIEIEDAGNASVHFLSDVMGSINWSNNVYNKNYEGSITILAEKGTIKIGGPYLNKIDFWDVKSTPLPDNINFVDLPNQYSKYQGSSSNHDKVIEEVVKCVRNENNKVVEGEEGINTIRAIENIYSNSDYINAN